MYYDIKASGQRIQQLRKAAGFTLEGLSDRLNITDRQLRRIEKGEKRLPHGRGSGSGCRHHCCYLRFTRDCENAWHSSSEYL